MSFWSFPDKQGILRTLLCTYLFCLPLAGSEDLFFFALGGQAVVIVLGFLLLRNGHPPLLKQLHHYHPATRWLMLGWLASTLVSLALVFNSPANGWQRLFAITRELFVFIQVGYCLTVMRFLLISRTSFNSLLLSFCAGFGAIAFLHFALLYWGPACDSETWLKDPFLSPNMRDIGDLATAVIMVACASLFLEQQRSNTTVAFGLFLLGWTYLLWSGGRTAIISALAVNLAMAALLAIHRQLTIKRSLLALAAMPLAYLLCNQLSIYDWNGLVRYSSEWQQNASEFKGDITSGRMEMWIWSWQAFLQKPWFGHGPFGFFFLPERYAHQFWHDHPHNLVLQALIEWGSIGTVFFLAFLGSLAVAGLRELFRPDRLKEEGFLASAGIVLVLAIGSLTGGSFWDFQPTIILVTAFACFPWLPSTRQAAFQQRQG